MERERGREGEREREMRVELERRKKTLMPRATVLKNLLFVKVQGSFLFPTLR